MANHLTNPLRQVMNRKIKRNIMRNHAGCNKIGQAWRKMQLKDYGFVGYLQMRLSKTPQPQRMALRNELFG